MGFFKIQTLILFLHSITFLSWPLSSFAQGEMENWYFGENAGLRFNQDGTVAALDNGALNSYEGSATISDANGELLFYTDGSTIYNRNHAIMDNGANLLGNPSSTQSALVVPLPETPDFYYVFTVDHLFFPNTISGLNYSVVDMTQDNGNGSVVQKNINLLAYCSEKIAAVVKDCVDNSIWIVTLSTATGQWYQNPIFDTFYAYELNASGILRTPVVSNVTNSNIVDDQGYLKFSIDGTKIASANLGSGLYVYDFDSENGLIENEQEIEITSPNTFSYGVEFSLSGRYLYVSTRNNYFPAFTETSNLLQYDLDAANISDSQVILDDRVLFRGALQMGVNGRIYRALSDNYFDGLPYLGVINNPENAGLAADYEHLGVPLINNSFQGLPPFVASLARSEKLTEDENTSTILMLCVGDTLQLTASLSPGATYEWEKNDIPFINPDNNRFIVPTSSLSDEGRYTVTVRRPGLENCPIIGETVVSISPIPVAPSVTNVFCDVDDANGQDGIMEWDLTEFSIDPQLDYLFYESLTDIASESSIINPETYSNIELNQQIIWYKVTNTTGCEAVGELTLIINTVPELYMEAAYAICGNSEVNTIEATPGFDGYNWFLIEGAVEVLVSTASRYNPEQEGAYILEGVINTSVAGEDSLCFRRVSFTVSAFAAGDEIEVLISDNGNNNQIEVKIEGSGIYEYSVDGVNYQDSPYFEGLPPGVLIVYVNNLDGCGVYEIEVEIDETISTSQFPKFFTPNADGFNDYWNFVPNVENNDVDISEIYIYNRYGQFLVQFSPLDEGWDGTFNGRPQLADDYWFKAITFEKKVIKGHFALIY